MVGLWFGLVGGLAGGSVVGLSLVYNKWLVGWVARLRRNLPCAKFCCPRGSLINGFS